MRDVSLRLILCPVFYGQPTKRHLAVSIFAAASVFLLNVTAGIGASSSSAPEDFSARNSQSKPPKLIDISPASGPAGEAYPLQATIRGTAFMPAGNVIQFGPIKIAGVPSRAADRISFGVPKIRSSGSEAPPMVLQPGEYQVTVTTSAGTSNALKFTFTPGP